MRGPFVLGGARARKPRQYLMNDKGLSRNEKSNPVETNETIHFSVRVLLGAGLRTCSALQKYATIISDSRVTWELLHTDGKETSIQLREEEFGLAEHTLLENWMRQENEMRCKHSLLVVKLMLTLVARRRIGAEAMPEGLSGILLHLLPEANNPTIQYGPIRKIPIPSPGFQLPASLSTQTDTDAARPWVNWADNVEEFFVPRETA
jgi:hypothetical protein